MWDVGRPGKKPQVPTRYEVSPSMGGQDRRVCSHLNSPTTERVASDSLQWKSEHHLQAHDNQPTSQAGAAKVYPTLSCMTMMICPSAIPKRASFSTISLVLASVSSLVMITRGSVRSAATPGRRRHFSCVVVQYCAFASWFDYFRSFKSFVVNRLVDVWGRFYICSILGCGGATTLYHIITMAASSAAATRRKRRQGHEVFHHMYALLDTEIRNTKGGPPTTTCRARMCLQYSSK